MNLVSGAIAVPAAVAASTPGDLARHGHGLTFRHADAERYAVR
ncbi:hypothetical protein [Paraburkholderia guartelaensis]|nr:hypothetical protein [Paraburkholderia guartelaensis]